MHTLKATGTHTGSLHARSSSGYANGRASAALVSRIVCKREEQSAGPSSCVRLGKWFPATDYHRMISSHNKSVRALLFKLEPFGPCVTDRFSNWVALKIANRIKNSVSLKCSCFPSVFANLSNKLSQLNWPLACCENYVNMCELCESFKKESHSDNQASWEGRFQPALFILYLRFCYKV